MGTYKDLRQGDLIPAKHLLLADEVISLNKIDSVTAEYCVLLSQDCDIVHEKLEEEPILEFIVCTSNLQNDGNLRNGKNPRRLQLNHNDLTLTFFIHDRFFIKKDICSSLNFTEVDRLEEDNIRILKKWIGHRYTRSAFPDEFNRRISKSKKASKIASKEISEQISHIFFDVEDKELLPEQDYNLNVLIVTEADEDKKAEIEDKYFEALNVNGVKVNIHVVSEDDVPLSMLRKYKRWEKDSYSLNGEAAPLDEIDSL